MPRKRATQQTPGDRAKHLKATVKAGRTAKERLKDLGNGEPLDAVGLKEVLSADKLPQDSPHWLWDRRVMVGAVTLLAGDQSAGKSTLAGVIAAAVTGGPPLPGGPEIRAGGVLWLGAEEDPAQAVRPRLQLFAAHLPSVYFPERPASGGRRRIKLPLHAAELRQLARYYGARLIVLDPITSHIEEGLIADSGTTARAVLESLTELCQDVGCAAVCIKHPRKGVYGPLIERVAGSREWIQVPRCVAFLHTVAEGSGDRVLVSMKPGFPGTPPSLRCHIQEEGGVVGFAWGEECVISPNEIGTEDGTPGDRDALADAKALLRLLLDSGQQRYSHIAKCASEAGISESTLRRAKAAEGVTSHPEGSNEDRTWNWRKPVGGWR